MPKNDKPQHDCLATALAAAQGELTDPPKNKTAKAGSYSYKYTDIAGVLSVVRPVLSKHGIAVVQGVSSSEDGRLLKVSTSLMFKDEVAFSEIAFPMGNDIQKTGGLITYLRRYSLCAAVGVAADEDDDGRHARTPPRRQERREAPPAPSNEHDPSWADHRAKFCAQLGDLGTSYETVRDHCVAQGWGKPSTWPLEQRMRLLTDLNTGALVIP